MHFNFGHKSILLRFGEKKYMKISCFDSENHLQPGFDENEFTFYIGNHRKKSNDFSTWIYYDEHAPGMIYFFTEDFKCSISHSLLLLSLWMSHLFSAIIRLFSLHSKLQWFQNSKGYQLIADNLFHYAMQNSRERASSIANSQLNELRSSTIQQTSAKCHISDEFNDKIHSVDVR